MINYAALKKMKNRLKNKLASCFPQTTDYRKSYSQEGEDMILADLLLGQSEGYYVDIGAFHPTKYSNTKYFYDLGWHGINIEPSPNAIQIFESQRPRDLNLNFGISDKNTELTFYIFPEAALNTFDHERVVELERTTSYKHSQEQIVPVKNLAEVLEKYAKDSVIDFMNIDVEWHELEVLRSSDWRKFRPRYLLIEILNFSLLEISKNPLHDFLVKANYEFMCKTPRTCFYRAGNE